MRITRKACLTSVGALALLLPIASCSVDVREAQSGKHSDVDIRTPAGNLSVRTDVDARDTGLGVYPGAWPARDRHDDESANVNIGTPWFGLKVVAAKFESNDPPESVLNFYRNEMRAYGSVTECRGDVDFRGTKGAKQPFCKEKGSSTHVELITGTEERQRMVVVKPRGDGSEFSVVYIETRGDN